MMASNIDNPMDRLESLTQRIRKRLEGMGLAIEHIAFSPSIPGSGHMVQLVLRLEATAIMTAQDPDVALTDDERAEFEVIMSGAASVDSGEVNRESDVREVEQWLRDDL